MLGRLFHLTVDAVMVSTVLAGVRRSSGFTYVHSFETYAGHQADQNCRIETEKLSDPTVRSIAESYLGFGETVFDMIQGTAVNSQYFKRDSRK